AYFLNQYLESGDTEILNRMYSQLQGTNAWTKDHYGQWELLYKLNQILPEERKIHVVGIDVEFQYLTALAYMAEVLPDRELPQEIREPIARIIKASQSNPSLEDVEKLSRDIHQDIQEQEALYDAYLGEAFFGFRLVNDNVLHMLEANNSGAAFNQTRDLYIMNNFAEIYPTLTAESSFYGQWGLKHIFQGEQEGIRWLSGLIDKQIPELQGKVLSIGYAYENCIALLRMGMEYKPVRFDTLEDAPYINHVWSPFAEGHPYTLFRLNGKNSPFAKQLLWPLNQESGMPPLEGVTTDYIQYLVVIRDSPASKPLNQ
ncbi:MAG: hypothetical protein K6T85_03990, partial [Gorillibacterium sp.]|nr:hypothetical protein [Gorillibacterium sp.]